MSPQKRLLIGITLNGSRRHPLVVSKLLFSQQAWPSDDAPYPLVRRQVQYMIIHCEL